MHEKIYNDFYITSFPRYLLIFAQVADWRYGDTAGAAMKAMF
jgi:hypothetical protein